MCRSEAKRACNRHEKRWKKALFGMLISLAAGEVGSSRDRFGSLTCVFLADSGMRQRATEHYPAKQQLPDSWILISGCCQCCAAGAAKLPRQVVKETILTESFSLDGASSKAWMLFECPGPRP